MGSKAKRPAPPKELRDLIYYQDGEIYFTELAFEQEPRRKRTTGALGNRKSDGYKETMFTIDGEVYPIYVHRAIYWWHTGEWPEIVDHINGDKTDNRIENLRASNVVLNHFNSKGKKSNTGYRGVSYNKRDNDYRISIALDKGEQLTLHGYKTALSAAVARDCIALAYYGEHAKLNVLDKLAGMRD